MVRSVLVCLFTCLTCTLLTGQSLEGLVSNQTTNEPVSFATVQLLKNDILVVGTVTDIDGKYVLSNLDPGTYDLLVTFLGFADQRIVGLIVTAGKVTRLDVKMSEEGVTMDEVVVVDYRKPLVEQDNTTSGAVVTSEEIRNLFTRNINAIASTTAGASSADEGGAITIRGSRPNGTDYYVDGVRVQASLVPETEIDQLQIITGGIEAKYGDVTGGVISITTKGPSNKFSGGLEAESSNAFDAFDNSLINFNISGPILKNPLKQTVLGFRLSGRYVNRLDEDPPAIDVYRIKEEKLRELEENPIIDIGGNPFLAADFLTEEDVDALPARPYERQEGITLNTRLDARLTKGIDVSLTGAYTNNKNQNSAGEAWELLNSQNNPFNRGETLRGNFRFRHRFGVPDLDGKSTTRKSGLIQNGIYTIQATYERSTSDVSDERHGENYFNYGYVGNFDIEWVPTFVPEFNDETQMLDLVHNDYRQVLRNYQPGTLNPVLANYNKGMGIDFSEGLNGNVENYIINTTAGGINLLPRDAFFAPNGNISGVFTSSWNFHTNVGAVFNAVSNSEGEVITFNANGGFDLIPKNAGRHHIELGLLYEQRINRSYTVAPVRLWDIARQEANNHILGIVEGADFTGDTIMVPEVGVGRLRELTIEEGEDAQFFRRIRETLGVPLNEFVNVDGLSPDQLRLDMFSARELNDQGVLGYFGYDLSGQ